VLTTDELPYVPFFCYALTRCGTRHRDYVDLARRIDLYTGGMGATAASRTKCDEDAASIPFVVFRGKCLNRNGEALFDLAAEMMTAADFTDGNRLKTLLLEYRANMESGVVYNGHRLAMSLAARNFTKSRLIGERWSGIHQLKTIKDLTADLNPQILGDLGERLMAIGGRLFSRDNLRIALVGEADAVDRLTSNTQSLTETLEGGAGDGFSAPGIELDPAVVREGWTTGTTVSFVARAHPVARFGHPDAPVLEIAAKLLRSLYLHREIREKGGAYGGFAAYNSEEGLFYFASYRDPRIRETLEVFDGAESFLRAGDYTEEDITEAILQVCQNIDRPDPPGPKARKAFIRSLIGLTDNARQQYKEEILSVDRKRVGDIANKYFHPESGNRSIAVISGDDLLAAANRETDAPFTIHRI
jgi:hypothetical protein